ncbi:MULTISPECIES: imidazoleglycerol-phosphate dehydratase HisB [Bacillus]|uniref:Imidazoleglycerol-phosphate dehydratase n=1 Tax=Bacillus pseudomycoides TaxID=64104 RepID=A0A1Y3MKI4_9BACI|nr:MULTISPECIES: imidazoleglycerol-phosphate dehydratase HisB [Bacillus cereus group]EOP56741.1 imidazoleglycerol-phosphate dehydratase [Bacillus cereus VD136]EOP74725.1 imidazoleglycerol-phosphate dehydratase [Bacillus cereus VDM006]EOQ14103.1 imidazoleglycerol-phosphate dehydratase [Bacillus cereus VDM021]OOG93269.1 Imidazoleglycerol-phosphate dehydratase [Bacillus mycoides]MDF2083980.1 imidazoleglycerol-phosphate dehydratase HisB [Bacillus pseudomycoides]
MREASQVRGTTETKIKLSLQLDESTNVSIQTGVGFFDHMLTLFAKHGRFGLQIEAEGDVFVDAHHTVEDVGIVLGNCLKEALQNKEGINRYGAAYVPMDEALGFVAIDISGRSYLVFQGELKNPKLGDFDTELTEEFFRAVAHAANITLHARILYGSNTHHKIEALFKAFGRALREAVDKNDKIVGVNSTKGLL